MFLCFYGNVLVTSFTVILRPLDYGTATRGNPGLRPWSLVFLVYTHHSELQVITALSLIYTLYGSPLHTQSGSQSSLVVSWQRIYNSLIVTAAHMKSSFHSLIPFLPSLLNHSTAIARDSILVTTDSLSKSKSKSKSKQSQSYVTTDCQSASPVLASSTHLGIKTRYFSV
jgi:hypothetical protein